jgi:hypothetical protein
VCSDKKDVSCLWEMTVNECGGQRADSVGTVGRRMKNKGRHAAGWHSAPWVSTVGVAHDNGPCGREVQRSGMDQSSGGHGLCRPWSTLHRKTWQAWGLCA